MSSVVLDPTVLNKLVPSGGCGGNGKRRPPFRSSTSGDEDDAERRFEALRAQREWLLEVGGGCENTLTFLLALHSGAISIRQAAKAMGKAPSTVLRAVRRYLDRYRRFHAARRVRDALLAGEDTIFDVARGNWVDERCQAAFAVDGTSRVFADLPSEQQLVAYLTRHTRYFHRRPQHFVSARVDSGYQLAICVLEECDRGAGIDSANYTRRGVQGRNGDRGS